MRMAGCRLGCQAFQPNDCGANIVKDAGARDAVRGSREETCGRTDDGPAPAHMGRREDVVEEVVMRM